MTSDAVVLGYVQGYKIPFKRTVSQPCLPKETIFSVLESDHLSKLIKDMKRNGVISPCSSLQGQFISKIFLVPKKDGTYRFILNLKKLNEFIEPEHFKLENRKLAESLITKHDYLATLDLKEAYYLVSIHEGHRKFLRFHFQGQLYEFNCLPFGLSTAPFVFTKLMKPVIGLLRSKGLLSVIYLDDFLLIGHSRETCLDNIHQTERLLKELGFVINYKKSILNPSKQITFLGFVFNSENMVLSLPESKQSSIKGQLDKFQRLSSCTIREFSQLIGTLVAVCPAVPYGLVYTKGFERQKFLELNISGKDFESRMQLPDSLSNDLKWWSNHILLSKKLISWKPFILEIFTDASLTGWGVYCQGKSSHGHWSKEERDMHINQLELLAVYFGLKCFASTHRNCRILLRVDNTTAISYVNRMGGIKYQALNLLAKELWQWCEERRIHIFASYIKSSDNFMADEASRRSDDGIEWELAHNAFRKIVRTFFNPLIDLFATRINTKCSNFVSWFPDPDAITIDAFTISWKSKDFYAFPPFSQIPKVLHKIQQEKARGIVVVPWWPTQPWFPLFNDMLECAPIMFTPHIDLVFSSHRQPHPLWRHLTLAAGLLSGNLIYAEEFHWKQPK